MLSTMSTDTTLASWVERYGQAWEQRDPDAAARLFATDARYFETPYAEPFRGPEGVRAYWAKVTADQADVSFSGEPLGMLGEFGVARWSARFRSVSSGAQIELNGVFVLEFDGEGRVTTLREWWHVR
jgi:limonene-1,2-epoxide hydrolase